jgi:hypothetical protein
MQETHDLRRVRLAGLIAVLVVAFALPITTSLSIFFSRAQPYVNSDGKSNASSEQFVISLIFELAALSALWFILRKQLRSFLSIGVSPSWRDLPESIVLAVVAISASWLLNYTLFYGYQMLTGRVLDLYPKNVEFLHITFGVPVVLFLLVNPFYEELIARAFMITETTFLIGEKDAAVLLSVILQTSYHLYQGLLPALVLGVVFLIFSLYFAKRGRILPVVLAHLYMDVIAFLAISK